MSASLLVSDFYMDTRVVTSAFNKLKKQRLSNYDVQFIGLLLYINES